jgi:hypothetical protein
MTLNVTPEALARRFHETYERLAPGFGYRTRESSAVLWEEVPDVNRRLMIAVCAEILGPVHDLDPERTMGPPFYERIAT